MPFPSDCYDPERLDLMTRALDVAWNAVVMRRHESDRAALHTRMEIRIMAAVRDGERDDACLSQAALELVVPPNEV